jgi:transcription elongation factor GreA
MIMAKIDTLLKEEKILTKSELSSYKAESFSDLDKYIKKIDPDNFLAVKEACDNKVAENSESIVGRYVGGSIGMLRRPFDENISMTNLLITFYDVHNWECVEFLCNKILALNENKRALRILADCYEETGREEQRYTTLERLVKVDIEEKKIVKLLAQHYLETGNLDKADFYYKRGMLRFIAAKDNENAYICYKELLKLKKDDFGFFLGVADKAQVSCGAETGLQFLRDLLAQNREDINNSILILKKMLEYDPAYNEAKTQLIDCYKKNYGTSARYGYCMKVSGLAAAKGAEVNRAINAFETDIAYDLNSFVYQRSIDKVGKIVDINDTAVTVLFAGLGKKTMSADMARRALEPLPKTNIKVLKLAPPEKLKAKITSDIKWALTILIQSHGNQCSIKDIKADLTPSILDSREWLTFLRDAKEELMNNPYFSNVAGENDTYMLRTTPITMEEKKLALFKAETDFYKKVQIIRDFIKDCDTESESFMEMIKFFNTELKKATRGIVTDTIISSYLLLDMLSSHDKVGTVTIDSPVTFTDLYSKLEDKIKTFEKINNPDLKKCFIEEIMENDSKWPQVLKQLFPYYTYSFIPECLNNNGQGKVFLEILKESVDNYKDSADVFLWALKYDEKSDSLWQKAGIDSNRLLITQIMLLDFTCQCIENKSNVTENKKRYQILCQILFTEKKITRAIQEGNEENALNLYSLIANSHIEPGRKIEVKHEISKKFPSFKFFDDSAPIDTSAFIPSGFLCTKAAFDRKKAELDHIQHVELPQVAEEIADARALGDLRENSEYQYGKDKQKNLNAMMKTLSDEIEKAQIILPSKVDSSKVGFGTEVTLLDKNENKEVTYQIFGQWESNPDENIINFKTPLGMNLMNKTVNEEFTFSINGQKHSYKVLSIKALDF